ncbi:acyl-CoA dehydrogenase C-terminal domain-containing protein [Afifella sp. IM 167]|uniref:acyl-CoA dehydrogenase C-terminal domain-containing protein n=1 Tax=Afifella sp. IM 167 TaxID=2033586 RepID=UPI001CCCEE9C|nr:acyl-CoA dehydrogenase C-terminal domain-containing protein [Afifella sp. IM 167]MBZ8133880.1 acyl-CoA dehydrogenase [Afifella sp. IM 167]
MPDYHPPVRDTLFVLHELLGVERLSNLPGFAEASPETVEAVLEEGARFCREVLTPLNRVGDRQGCTRHADGQVTTPSGFKDAYRLYAEGGWVGLSADPEHGGQGLPFFLAAAMNEFAATANMAWAMYPGLAQGAIAALTVHGGEMHKRDYLPRIVSGEWLATMNLTEPHCGTDLGLIRTRAAPAEDGSYRITGQKIFISGGEHDLTDNIIHLVLARIEGAPAGVKGISLFLVPKRLPDAAGAPGEANGVSCGALEEKMGIHGNATCVMNYEEAKGWLVGEPHKGLKAMFTMMNEARLGVGIQGLAQSEVAYQNAVAYARERRQGRPLHAKAEANGAAPAPAPIIVHPDIRRTLMGIRSFNEAARALVLTAALTGDIAARSPDAAAREQAEDWLALITPVIKGVLTDRGFENTVAAQQVFGGHGYIAEHGMEQFVRDARIAMIYEGANGIQALDLVGRKLAMNNGRAVQAYFAELAGFVSENEENEALAPLLAPLKEGIEHLQKATMWLAKNGAADPNDAGAGASDYMHLFGLVALGHIWAKMAKVAAEKLSEGAGETSFYETKLALARYYMERTMPETGMRLKRIATGAGATMALPAEAF